jgi:hypothetical protein
VCEHEYIVQKVVLQQQRVGACKPVCVWVGGGLEWGWCRVDTVVVCKGGGGQHTLPAHLPQLLLLQGGSGWEVGEGGDLFPTVARNKRGGGSWGFDTRP